MKKFLTPVAVLAVLVGLICVFGIVSHADATIPTDEVESTLSVPEGENYVFYVQTRANRLDAAKNDVRVICVVDQAWLEETPNFITKITFTDGTTPVTTKTMGINTFFQSITAYGTNGQVETYTAADGAIMFGWIITDVPEAYSDVTTNVPSAEVITEAGVTPEIEDNTDYDTPVQTKDDINMEIDGIIYEGETNVDGKIGDMNSDKGSKATYILTGNYDGIYDITVYYTDMEGRWLHISINGVEYCEKITNTSGSWDDVSQATSFTFSAELKTGANVITFSAKNGWGPNLVDFDLERVADVADPVKTITTDDVDVYTFENGARVDGVRFSFMDTPDQKAHLIFDDVDAGEYLAKVYFCAADDGRAITLSVNGAASTTHRVYGTGSWDNLETSSVCLIPVTLTDGENTLTFSGSPDGAYSAPFWKVELVPIA